MDKMSFAKPARGGPPAHCLLRGPLAPTTIHQIKPGLLVVLLVLLGPGAAGAEPPSIPAPIPSPPAAALATPSLAASFIDGFLLRSPDGRFKLRIGGMVQADGRWFPGNTLAGPVDNFLARSVRIQLDATLWSIVDMRVMPDFGQGQLRLFDAYVEVRFHPALRLRAGKFKVPFDLERIQTEGRTAFMERALTNNIVPNRDLGVMLWGEVADGTLTWAAAIFNGTTDNSLDDREIDADKEEVARLFLHPGRPTKIAALRDLGIGGAFSFGQLTGSTASPQLASLQTDGLNTFFRFAAGSLVGVDDTTRAVGNRWRATAHGYYYFWRLGFYGEYVWNRQDAQRARDRDSVTFQAWQGYATFLLTDDAARFDGVLPRRPFLPEPSGGGWGPGAFEVAIRYSGIRVSDSAFAPRSNPVTGLLDPTFSLADPTRSARAATSCSVGLTWYLSGNAKLQADYVRTGFQGGAAAGGDRPAENAVMGRIQVQM